MPYLLLIIGVIIALYALYKFFIRADVQQIKALFLTAFFTIITIALLVLSLTGRLPAALALLGAMIPFGLAYLRERRKSSSIDNREDDIIDITPIEEDEDDNKDEEDKR